MLGQGQRNLDGVGKEGAVVGGRDMQGSDSSSGGRQVSSAAASLFPSPSCPCPNPVLSMSNPDRVIAQTAGISPGRSGPDMRWAVRRPCPSRICLRLLRPSF